MLPDMRDLSKIQLKFFSRPHDAEPLGKGLHHAILDSIMDHLDVMTGAMRTNMPPAFIRGRSQSLEDWTDVFHNIGLTANHQAVSLLQAPDAATCTTIYEFDAL